MSNKCTNAKLSINGRIVLPCDGAETLIALYAGNIINYGPFQMKVSISGI